MIGLSVSTNSSVIFEAIFDGELYPGSTEITFFSLNLIYSWMAGSGWVPDIFGGLM